MALPLKDFSDKLFSNDYYESVTNVDKRSNFFMISRQMSCKFPIEASRLSTIHVNKENCMDFWHELMMKLYNGRKPSWLWTFPNKNNITEILDKKLVDKFSKIDKGIIVKYCKIYEIDQAKLNLLKKFDFERLINELEILSR